MALLSIRCKNIQIYKAERPKLDWRHFKLFENKVPFSARHFLNFSYVLNLIQKISADGNSLAVRWLRTRHFHCQDRVRSLVRELRATWHGQKKKKEKFQLNVKHIISIYKYIFKVYNTLLMTIVTMSLDTIKRSSLYPSLVVEHTSVSKLQTT